MTSLTPSRASNLAFYLGVAVVFFACHPTDSPSTSDAAAGGDSAAGGGSDAGGDAGADSIACYVASQFLCHEYPQATADQKTNLPVECSSDSGDLTTPAACPTANFGGKCTVGTGEGRDVKRFYTGSDLAYDQDFCVNTAMGVWSTQF